MAKAQHDIALRHLDSLLNVGAIGGLTDAQLLEMFTTRQDEAAELAFAVLVDRHGPMVLPRLPGDAPRLPRRRGRLPGHLSGPGQEGPGIVGA